MGTDVLFLKAIVMNCVKHNHFSEK